MIPNYEAFKNYLMHYGMPRRSGRYPWGSGKDPYQHSGDFLSRVDELKKQGMSEKDIADAFGLSTTQFRTQVSLAKDERRAVLVETAKDLRAKGYSLNEIAEKMGYDNDSSVRSLLNENSEARMNQAKVAAEYLKQIVDEKGMIDVGAGVEREIGDISKEKLAQALYILEMEGYEVYGGRLEQATNPGKFTTLKVLCPPGTEHSEIYTGEIHSVADYDKILTDDGNVQRNRYEYPASMDSKRLMINYAEDGGIDKDGIIEVRRGKNDLYLGDGVNYAQVRILVDGTHYLKGMAVYADDLPDGIDIRFNTNKEKGTPALGTKKTGTVLKEIKDDPDNPFGALLRQTNGQSYYDDPDGIFIGEHGQHQSLSLINKTRQEGDWGEWSKELPAQFLAKQNKSLISKQLNLAIADKYAEYDEICNLTNPTVKKLLLSKYAEECDSASVHLKAAALPRQKYQVILPLTTIKDNEVYAPQFNNGEKVALIRFPHGGTFEIPILTVNNKNKEGIDILGNTAKDAVGITKKNADRLSGADFDGDTVLVIPCNSKVKINSTPALKGLENFDPKVEYGPGSTNKSYRKMKNTQNEMGRISNLITDMTIKGATDDELARAVRHSMVVIDAEKHGLDYKRSEQENGIASLREKYQSKPDGGKAGGASTLISRAKAEVSVDKRRGSPTIDKETGELQWKTAYDKDLYYPEKKKVPLKDEKGHKIKNEKGEVQYETYKDPKTGKEKYVYVETGKIKTRKQQSTQMAETKDAKTLYSDPNAPAVAEVLYGQYANTMKSLANQARKEMISTPRLTYDPVAKEKYSAEVAHLQAQLNVVEKNKPRERQAQVIANSTVKAKKEANPDMTKSEEKKLKQQELTAARAKVGAKRTTIDISDSEWAAIQAGAVSENTLMKILNNTDTDKIRERATPRTTNSLSQAKISKIQQMSASGYTTAEIAEAVGCSSSTVNKYT
jgi:transcriptional regulator with XRE-family HTH domain